MAENKKEEQPEKTIDDLIREFREKTVELINDCGLPTSVVGLLVRELAQEVAHLEKISAK